MAVEKLLRIIAWIIAGPFIMVYWWVMIFHAIITDDLE